MAWWTFASRLIVAFIFGGLVGAERQWRQRTAGLRTNCLVAVGSAMFVMMGGVIEVRTGVKAGLRHTSSPALVSLEAA